MYMKDTLKFIENVNLLLADVKNITLTCKNEYDKTITYINNNKIDHTGNCFFMCELSTICLKGRPKIVIKNE